MWRQLDVEEWSARRTSSLAHVRTSVESIIARIRAEGDSALFDLTSKFDKVQLSRLRISRDDIDLAYTRVDPQLVKDLIKARDNITRFHQMQRQSDMWLREVEPGLTLGVKVTPLQRVGAYVPGGRAAYPSTVLMCAVPARVAGVREVICCTPPPVNPLTLVATDLAGVDEVYQIGGAQAIAAMALGTKTIAPVQKIVGPGNVYVTMAKMLLRDHAEIDFPAGPSEIVVLADDTGDAEFIAADILAQAEHDPNSVCALVTTDHVLANKVGRIVDQMEAKAERKEIISRSLMNAGYVMARDMDSAVEIVNFLAPEHLSIQVADPLTVLKNIRNAGSIFVGKYAAVACGDYASGTNHVLPTAGYARTYSGLDVGHFCKRSSIQIIERQGLDSIGDVVENLARAEGLNAHAQSVKVRRKE